MTMIEQVARAIYEAEHLVSLPVSLSDLQYQGYIGMAQAAIAAMREPTHEMVWAAADQKDRGSWWRAMIDAALNEVS